MLDAFREHQTVHNLRAFCAQVLNLGGQLVLGNTKLRVLVQRCSPELKSIARYAVLSKVWFSRADRRRELLARFHFDEKFMTKQMRIRDREGTKTEFGSVHKKRLTLAYGVEFLLGLCYDDGTNLSSDGMQPNTLADTKRRKKLSFF